MSSSDASVVFLRLNCRGSGEALEHLGRRRAAQRPIPSVPETIRRLVEIGRKAKF
jgi:hypothetical protein